MRTLTFVSLLSIFWNGSAQDDHWIRSSALENEDSRTSRQLMDSLDPFESYFEAQYITSGGAVDFGLAAQALSLTYNRLLLTEFDDPFQRQMGRVEVLTADTNQQASGAQAFAFIRAEGFCHLCPSEFRFTDQVSGRRDLSLSSLSRTGNYGHDYRYDDSRRDSYCDEARRPGVPTVEELRVAYADELKRLRTNIIDVPFLAEVGKPKDGKKPSPTKPKPVQPAYPPYRSEGSGKGKGKSKGKSSGSNKSRVEPGSKGKGNESKSSKGGKGNESKSSKGGKGDESKPSKGGKGSKRRERAMVEMGPIESTAFAVRSGKGKGSSKSGKGSSKGGQGKGSKSGAESPPMQTTQQCPEVQQPTSFSGEFTSYFNALYSLLESTTIGVEQAVSALPIAYNRVAVRYNIEVCMLDAVIFDPRNNRRLSFEEVELRRQLQFFFDFNIQVIGFCFGCPQQFTFSDQVSGRRELSSNGDCPQPLLPSDEELRTEYNLVIEAFQTPNVQECVELREINRPN